MIVHLIDGTYELFRHFYGARRAKNGEDTPFGGVRGVLHGVLEMFETGGTHIGVATDHIIESFRNQLWRGYKTGEGIVATVMIEDQSVDNVMIESGAAGGFKVRFEGEGVVVSEQ